MRYVITLTELEQLDPDQSAAIRNYATELAGSIEPLEPGAAPRLRYTPAGEGTPDVLEFHEGTAGADWHTIAMGAGEPPVFAHAWSLED